MTARTSEPMNDVNPGYAHIYAKAGGGIANRAYEGCYLEDGEEYRFSFYSRGSYQGKITFSLVSEGRVIASAEFDGAPDKWEKREAIVRARETGKALRLVYARAHL